MKKSFTELAVGDQFDWAGVSYKVTNVTPSNNAGVVVKTNVKTKSKRHVAFLISKDGSGARVAVKP